LNLQASGGPPEESGARIARLGDAAAAVPGVRSASVAAIPILYGGGWSSGLVGIGDGPITATGRPELWLNATTPGWFETMGVPLRTGRDFNATDRLGSRHVAIVNEAFIRRFQLGDQSIGQSVRLGRSELHGFDAGARFEIASAWSATPCTQRRARASERPCTCPMAQTNPLTFGETAVLTINAAPARRAAVDRDIEAALTRVDPNVAFTVGTFDRLVEATIT
jgi:hypothetical protein